MASVVAPIVVSQLGIAAGHAAADPRQSAITPLRSHHRFMVGSKLEKLIATKSPSQLPNDRAKGCDAAALGQGPLPVI
jgi:hypothetical protein